MLFSILSLVLTVLFVVFIFWCISSFWAWLGRGKRLKGMCDQDLVSEDVKETMARLEALKAAQKLEKGQQGPVIHLNRKQIREIRKAEGKIRKDNLDKHKIGW